MVRVPFPVRVVPALTFQAWLTPPPLGVSTRARDRDEIADLSRCHFGGVPGFETGDGPLVLAVHGWGGRPAQMAPVARRLASEGFRVVVPALPGHAGGEKTDIRRAAAALRAVVFDVGAPEVVVGHSFAAMILRLGFAETTPDRVVLAAPALDVIDALEVFGDRLRLLPWARRGLRRRLEGWDPSLWPVLSGIHADQLPGADVLIVHDPGDEETPFMRSAAGHSRILAHPGSLDVIAGFATGRRARDMTAA
jgi:pimeloyl-ACP methyl ester carboxylesterase